MAGDFNEHHQAWYGKRAPSGPEVIRASTRSARFLVDWAVTYQFDLLNIPGTLTHLPRNDTRPTIPDLTYGRKNILNLTQGWAPDEGEGGDSDHVLITTTLDIKKPTFTPRRQHHRTDWASFMRAMSEFHTLVKDYETPELTLATADRIDNQIQEAINIAIPWSKPNKKSKSWWSPEISTLKNLLATAKKQACQNLDDEAYKNEAYPNQPKKISAK